MDRSEFAIINGCLAAWRGVGRRVTVPAGVRTIGKQVFSRRPGLTEVILPEGVTHIDWEAFYECRDLERVSLPDSLHTIGHSAFSGCSALTRLTLPAGVKTLASRAFAHCSGLIEVEIPPGLERLGRDVFAGCTALREMPMPGGGPEVQVDTDNRDSCAALWLYGSYPDQSPLGLACVRHVHRCRKEYFARLLEQGSLHGLENLLRAYQKVPLEYLEEMLALAGGDLGFTAALLKYQSANYTPRQLERRRTRVRELELGLCPRSAAEWRKIFHLSQRDGGLVITGYKGGAGPCLEIPDRIGGLPVIGIGRRAFWMCKELTAVYISPGLVQLEAEAFFGCEELRKIVLPPTLTSMGKAAFAYCRSLEGLSMPSGVTKVPNSLCANCIGLGWVNLPEGVEKLGSYAFSSCRSLTKVTLPQSLKVLGDRAFGWCSGLTAVELPQGPVQWGREVFVGCTVCPGKEHENE